MFLQCYKNGLDWWTVLGFKYDHGSLPLKVGAALQQPDATVPAQDGIIVASRPDLFRFGEKTHGLFKQGQQRVGRVSGAELGLRPAFVQQPHIIGPLVSILEAAKSALNLAIAVRGDTQELVGECETEQAERQLVFRLN